MLDVVNTKYIVCKHCGKKIYRDDKFILVHYFTRLFVSDDYNEPDYFCSDNCAKTSNPELFVFLGDMTLCHRNHYMYDPNTITYPNVIDMIPQSKYPKIVSLMQAFKKLVSKHNAVRIYIERNTTLNKLKERLENMD